MTPLKPQSLVMNNTDDASSDTIDNYYSRPLHSKIFFFLTLGSLSFTAFSLYRIFRSNQLLKPLETVKWQRLRMIGQAGVITGLTGSLVFEGLGYDTWALRNLKSDRSKASDYLLGLFARNSNSLLS